MKAVRRLAVLLPLLSTSDERNCVRRRAQLDAADGFSAANQQMEGERNQPLPLRSKFIGCERGSCG